MAGMAGAPDDVCGMVGLDVGTGPGEAALAPALSQGLGGDAIAIVAGSPRTVVFNLSTKSFLPTVRLS